MKLDWKAIVKLLAPIALAHVPHGDLIAPIAAGAITSAEEYPGKTGPEKLAIAMKVVDAGIVGVNIAHGSQLIDEAAVNSAVAAGVSTIVQAANVVHKGAK